MKTLSNKRIRQGRYTSEIDRHAWSTPSIWMRTTTFAPACSFNRYYDPSTDQFLSVDPDVQATDQPYAFVNDDPLSAEDPDGLMPLLPSNFENYPRGNLQSTIKSYLGDDVGIKSGKSDGKIVFYDKNDPAKEVIYDSRGNYYRISKVTPGKTEYYDSLNDTWGTDKQLGNLGLLNSHYVNRGESYSSTGDAAQDFSDGVSPAGDGGGGDGSGDLGSIGLFLVFPNICQLVPSACNTPKRART